MSTQDTDDVARDAVLKPSAPVSSEAVAVHGIDFDQYRDRDVTVNELVAAMATSGFQSSAIGEAVRIINDMVNSRLVRCCIFKTHISFVAIVEGH